LYAKKSNTQVVFALAPSIVQVEDNLWNQVKRYDTSINLQKDLPNTNLLAFAKANDIKMIDLMPYLINANRKGEKVYHSIEHHWNAKGNKVVADALSKYIQQEINNK